MKQLLLGLGLMSVFFSCHTKSSYNAKVLQDTVGRIDTMLVFSHGDTLHPVPVLTGDLENTLKMYSGKDSFEVFYGEWFVKIFLLNQEKFGIIGDSLFRIYKFDKGNWEKLSTEKGTIELQHFVITDITNDGKEDAVIYDDGGGINYTTKALIFNPTTNTLEHKKYLDLENLEVDTKNHLLKTWDVPHSIFGGSRKAFYRVVKDSIELEKEVCCYNQSESSNKNLESTLKMTSKKGSGYTFTTIYLPAEKAFSVFNKTLWNTTGNFDKKIFDK